MKGAITACLAQLVETRFGTDKWQAVLDHAKAKTVPGLKMPTSDIGDPVALQLIRSTMSVLNMTMEQAADAFGEHWCCVYAPNIYKLYYKRFTNARDMILGMDALHVSVTQNVPNARPPRFDYRWEDDRTLVVTYKSSRALLDLYIGLVRGVAKYFKENVSVQKASPSTCRIRFAAAKA